MLRKRIQTGLLIAAFAFAIMSGTGTDKLVGQSAQNKPSAQNPDEATPIQEGVMTEKQRAHSKLYKGYRFPQPIRPRVKGKPDLKVVMIGEPVPVLVQTLSCDADAIVLGSVQSKSSQITEDKDFVFTDYELKVEEVWKDNALRPINQSALLTLTRPGGAVKFNGKNFSAIDKSFSPLRIGGNYLFFVRYTPETGAYLLLNSASTFTNESGKIMQFREHQTPDVPDAGVSTEDFRTVVLAGQAACVSVKEATR